MAGHHKIIDAEEIVPLDWNDPSFSAVTNLWLSHELVTESGGLITSWEDSIGGVVLSNTGGAERPTLVEGQVNGKPAIQFDGINNGLFMTTANIITAHPNEGWFLVFNTRNNTDLNGIFQDYPGVGNRSRRLYYNHATDTVTNAYTYMWPQWGSVTQTVNTALSNGPHCVVAGYPGIADFIEVDGTRTATSSGASNLVSGQLGINCLTNDGVTVASSWAGEILAVIKVKTSSPTVWNNTITALESNLNILYDIEFS